MTNDDIDNLTGEALAAAVAVEVMGWVVHHRDTSNWVQSAQRNKHYEKVEAIVADFRPDRDWVAAGMVLDKIHESSRSFYIQSSFSLARTMQYVARIIGGSDEWSACAMTGPMAICRAALKCVRAGKGTVAK
jgi:hypothetical protein